MKLTILIISLIQTFIFLTLQSSSFQSCSKIDTLSFETNLDHLSCRVDSDSTLQIPLTTLASSKLSIQLSDEQENFQLLLQKDLERDFFHINYISKNSNHAFTAFSALKTIQFKKAGSTFSFILDDPDTPKFQGTLNKLTKYTLTIHIIEPYSKISPSSTSRFLFECSDGTFEIDGMCVRVCPTKFYKENNVCWPCGEGCGLCLSSTQCNNCQGITYFDSVTQNCVSECPEGYFQDYNNRVCVQCSEGCLKCNFPDGECTSSSFKRDMIINLIICLVMVAFITLCAYYCNKEAPEEQQSQPPQSQQEDPTKDKSNQVVPESVQRRGPRKGSNLLGPYNMLYEDPDVPEDGGEDDQIPTRRKKKRLTDFAKSRLLNLSMSKPFEVDDGNQDKAISHDSACKLFSTSASPMVGKSRFDLSPMILSKSPLLSSYVGAGTGRNLLSSTNMDDQQQQQDQKEQEKQDQKAIKTRSILFNMEDSPLKKARENLKRQLQASDEKKDAAPLALSSIKIEHHHFDTNEDEKVKSQKEDEVIREVSEPERDENTEGYKPDLSISSFVDRDDLEDLSSCTICGMNKRDCVIQPCRHTVACYACMEQFKESYGVCPRCQKMITGIQKMNNHK